ncbi:hypothetical protein ACFLX3_01560 [Chloroflexota bacterium]
MGKSSRPKEVPQWVRDFITQRNHQLYEEHWQSPKDRKGRTNDNIYLLCPFDKNEIEEIRIGGRKLRDEALIADTEKRRKARGAGCFVRNSGISDNDDLGIFEMHLRDQLLTPLSSQQMRETVAKHHRWEKWTEDPWGDSQKFYEWLSNISDDDTPAIWAINETLAGRTFLVYGTVWVLDQLDYSKMTEEDLLAYIGLGAENFLCVKHYTSWDNFERHYPTEPLPARLVNEELINGWPFWSLNSYRWFVASIYLWYFALNELKKRFIGHPVSAWFLHYQTATSSRLLKYGQALAPKDYRFPDNDESWRKFEKHLEPLLAKTSAKYKRIFSLCSEVDGHFWEQHYVEAQNALLEAANSLRAKDFIADGLDSKLLPNLQERIEEYLKRAARKERLWREVPESTFAKPGDRDRPLDWLTHKRGLNYHDEGDYTEQYSIDLNKLSSTELRVVLSAVEGYGEGYRLFSKKQKSYKQWWGKDYEKNMKALRRAGAKIAKS